LKKIIFIICSSFIYFNCVAQNPLVKQWDKRFGGNQQDWLESFVQTSDGGYLLGGYSASDSSGDKSQNSWLPGSGHYDFWVVKIDSIGNKQWDKRYGGIDTEELRSLKQTDDGGYILSGTSNSGITGDKSQPAWGLDDYWIIKIDSIGTKQWDKRFGGAGSEKLNYIDKTVDKGYILGGYTSTGISGDKSQPSWGSTDYWIVKTDSLGNKLWDKDYGGTDMENLSSVKQTRDKGYILGGYSYSGMNGDKTEDTRDTTSSTVNYRGDYWIVKTDSLGNKIWDKRFGGFINDYPSSLYETFDMGYVISGLSHSDSSGDKSQPSRGYFDYWVVKIDSLGNKLWDKRFGGSGSEGVYEADIAQTTDSGYVISGVSSSPISGDKTESNLGGQQCWIVKINSTGIKQWDKTIHTTGFEPLCYGIQTKDTCYAFALQTMSGSGGDKTDSSRGSWDYWIIKFCDTTQNIVQLAAFSADDSSYCEEHCFNFTDLSINSPTSWAWSFPGALPDTSNDQNPLQICYTTPGTYTVTLVATNASGSSTAVYPNFITIYGTPSLPYITVSGPNSDTLTSTPALTYQWNLDSIPISGATSQIYVATTGGSYTVTITDANNCSATSFPVQVTGISTFFNRIYLNINPNPVVNNLEVNLSLATEENIFFSINNPLGQQLFSYEKMIPSGTFKEKIELSKFDAGIYFLTVKFKNECVTRKFFKRNN
jgi:hypothetical protein